MLLLLTLSTLGLLAATVTRILAISVTSHDVEIAGRAGLIAILLGDQRAQASADIVARLRLGHVELDAWELASEHVERLARLRVEADDENHRAIAWEARTGGLW